MTARRACVYALLIALGLLFLAHPASDARYLGTDVMGNLAPSSGLGGLADRHPLSAYSLDYHVDVGITDLDGVPPTIAQWASAQMWMATSWVSKLANDLFAWAFSLDLINGANGALGPVGHAVRAIYDNIIGRTWLILAFTIAGIAAIYRSFVQRRHVEAFGSLALSIVCVILGMFFVFKPQDTVGTAASWSNDMSTAFLSATNQGSLNAGNAAKTDVSDYLFEVMIYRPWVVLEFGGVRHCVDTNNVDGNGYPTPTVIGDPKADVCRNHLRADARGYGGYAERFLRYPAGSDERDRAYTAMRDGDPGAPVTNPGPGRPPTSTQSFTELFPGWEIDKSDSPAVDIQQAGGAFQRFCLVMLILVVVVGMVAFLVSMSLAIILAQVLALVLLGFAPIALVVGAIGHERGHDLFRGWLGRLGVALFVKALYSLALGICLVVSGALWAATDTLPWMFSFMLQGGFFWALLVYRKHIVRRATTAAVGHRSQDRLPQGLRTQAYHAANHPVRAVAAAASVPHFFNRKKAAEKTENAKFLGEFEVADDRPEWSRSGAKRDGMPADSSSPPASAGREYSPPGPPPAKTPVSSTNGEQDNGMIVPGKAHIAAKPRRPESPGDAMVVGDPDRDTSNQPKVTVHVLDNHPPVPPPSPEDIAEARKRQEHYTHRRDNGTS